MNSDGALTRFILPDDEQPRWIAELGESPDWDEAAIAPVARQVDEYFARKRRDFDLPLAAEGTEFQQAVWRQLCLIPYGETISYGEMARRIGNPDAQRAVGMANNANPIGLIVPCHRVIGAGGKLVGFGGGLPMKVALLRFEGPEPDLFGI
ncbi:methylated-DNA--[protein]-cysteine S-methyltransferase [Lacibacterium aquatile]|uniref:Methylated-DNA--protein-cysteine methyltransferase n=1 Tax=Lacibacterium aquatile TaxID=1168082 RepID=A0ABW5DMY7_9PROT